MVFCKQCGNEIEREASFCVSCGTPAAIEGALNGKTVGDKPALKFKPKKLENKTNYLKKLKWIIPVCAVLTGLIAFIITGSSGDKPSVEQSVNKQKADKQKNEKKEIKPKKIVISEETHGNKISGLDKKIRSMQKRLEEGTPQSGDSLKSMYYLIVEKLQEKKKLAEFIRQQKVVKAKKLKAENERLIAQLKEDVKNYNDVVLSEYGKNMKATAWKTLAEKYPKRAKGVEAGNTDTLLYGFAELRVNTNAKNAKISVLNIKNPFHQGMSLKGGKYRLKIEAEGFIDKEVNVTLKPGEEKTARVDLVAYGRLYVSTNPKTASVRLLNFKEKYRDGMVVVQGAYKVEVSAKGYITEAKSVTVGPGEKEKISVSLIRMKFVYIKPGSFEMGSIGGDLDEKPVHRVTLSKGYYMQTTEVTQGQWRSVMGTNPSNFKNCGATCPVENVSWNDAKAFIRKLNVKEGTDKYRLPTEAEWEYACRAGSDTNYANDNSLDMMGWSDKNSGGKTHSVGQKKANSWGLYDMHGNVWEWCEDLKGNYPSGNVTDPVGPSTGSFRVSSRGGSWHDSAWSCRSANRYDFSPGNRHYNLGFRLVLSSGQ